MKRLTVLGIVSVLALLAFALIPRVKADERSPDQWDMKTIMTFQQPVEVPGKILPAGTYVFSTMDSVDLPNVVRIFNQNETTVIGTFNTRPAFALNPPQTTVMTFEERPGGRPAAVKTWWYPRNQFGHQFIYH
jgi:hypothetical protein